MTQKQELKNKVIKKIMDNEYLFDKEKLNSIITPSLLRFGKRVNIDPYSKRNKIQISIKNPVNLSAFGIKVEDYLIQNVCTEISSNLDKFIFNEMCTKEEGYISNFKKTERELSNKVLNTIYRNQQYDFMISNGDICSQLMDSPTFLSSNGSSPNFGIDTFPHMSSIGKFSRCELIANHYLSYRDNIIILGKNGDFSIYFDVINIHIDSSMSDILYSIIFEVEYQITMSDNFLKLLVFEDQQSMGKYISFIRDEKIDIILN